jgi:hypothetical protein
MNGMFGIGMMRYSEDKLYVRFRKAVTLLPNADYD